MLAGCYYLHLVLGQGGDWCKQGVITSYWVRGVTGVSRVLLPSPHTGSGG